MADLPELPVLDTDDGEVPDVPRTVLITGASGNLGGKLARAWRDRYDLILVDNRPGPEDLDVVVADLSIPDAEWTELLEEADAVVHLAADPNEFATWADLQGPNLDALNNVFLAAALTGCDRIIFASSNHAMGDYRFDGSTAPITTTLPPKPDGPYGGCKLVGERLGLALTRMFEISVVALRIGWCQFGANRPATLPDDWSRSIWLSDRDFVHLVTRAVEADLGDERFVVVNGTSRDRGSRWVIEPNTIGFQPEDDAWANAN
jgi:nucleoside-diphosphate-sugar epimerase